MSPKNLDDCPAAANKPPATPTLAPLVTSTKAVGTQRRMPAAKARTATRTLLVNTEVANSAAGADE